MNVTDKDVIPFSPHYTSNLEVKFDTVLVETGVKYAVFAEAVVWFQGQELRSNTYVHTIIMGKFPKSRNSWGDRSFSHAGPTLWNDLPLQICDIIYSVDTVKDTVHYW